MARTNARVRRQTVAGDQTRHFQFLDVRTDMVAPLGSEPAPIDDVLGRAPTEAQDGEKDGDVRPGEDEGLLGSRGWGS